MANITEEGKKARREYLKKWRANMTPEQREKRNAYHRRYYAEHKEYYKDKKAEYWNRKAGEEISEDGN